MSDHTPSASDLLPPCTAGDTGCGNDPCECRFPPDLLDRLLDRRGANQGQIEAEFAERLKANEERRQLLMVAAPGLLEHGSALLGHLSVLRALVLAGRDAEALQRIRDFPEWEPVERLTNTIEKVAAAATTGATR